ncbi:MAG: MMPL family transporter [Gemmatimonadota bacterium]
MLRAFAHALVRARWVAMAAWAIIGAVALFEAPKTAGLLNLRGGRALATESRRADDILTNDFARPFSEFLAVTIEGPSSFKSAPARETLDTLVAAARRLPYVRGVVSWFTTGDSLFLSRDGRLTFFLISVKVPSSDSLGGLVTPLRQELHRAMASIRNRDGYLVRVTGRAPLDLDVRTISAEDSHRLEARLLPISLVILVLAFGALVAALLPVIMGVLTIAVSLSLIGIAARMTPMSIFVLNLTSMIGLGVGIDYSLLMVTRFREELARGYRRREAAERTIATAGISVLNSGITVVVGFSALFFTPLVETRSVGLAGIIVVAVAVVLCTTLLPALLAVLGRSIDQPRWLARRLTWYHSPQVWEKWARSLARHPRRALVLGGATIAILTAPVAWIKIGLPARHWWPSQSEAGAGVETLSRMGVSGYIQPIRMLVQVPPGRTAIEAVTLRGLRALSDSMRRDPRVQDVRSIVDLKPGTSILAYSLLYSDLDSARVQYGDFLDAYLGTDNRAALLDVILQDTTSLTTGMEVVRHARRLVGGKGIKQLRGAEVFVGGYIASSVDAQDQLLHRFPLVIALVLGATAVMLAIAFRSLLVPIKAVIMNSLSVSAAFGMIVLVFQKGWGSQLFGLTGPTEAIFVFVPVLVFAVVFGLSMDYEVFLMSRIKEAFDRTGRNTEATMEGLSTTASVITSAALIMITVFGAFAFARVLMIQFLGFGLAMAVLLDATVIRMVLVPAFMHLMGRWNWWPGYRPKSSPPAKPT